MDNRNNGYNLDSRDAEKFILSLKRSLETVLNRSRIKRVDNVPLYIIEDLLDDINWYMSE